MDQYFTDPLKLRIKFYAQNGQSTLVGERTRVIAAGLSAGVTCGIVDIAFTLAGKSLN